MHVGGIERQFRSWVEESDVGDLDVDVPSGSWPACPFRPQRDDTLDEDGGLCGKGGQQSGSLWVIGMVHDELGSAMCVLEWEEGDGLALALWQKPAGEGDWFSSELGIELGTGMGTRREGGSAGVETSENVEHDRCWI